MPSGDCAKADTAAHLTGSLRDYFPVAEHAAIPERLSLLVEGFEAPLVASGERLGIRFRDDRLRALTMLRTFAMSLCANAARAGDLVQETMVRAWANRDRFVPGTNVTAWSFAILRTQFDTEMCKTEREVEDAERAHAATLTAAPDQDHVEALGGVMNLIGTRPLPQRKALLLVGAEGFTCEEAAARLGCQVGTVKSRVSPARSFLVDCLDH